MHLQATSETLKNNQISSDLMTFAYIHNPSSQSSFPNTQTQPNEQLEPNIEQTKSQFNNNNTQRASQTKHKNLGTDKLQAVSNDDICLENSSNISNNELSNNENHLVGNKPTQEIKPLNAKQKFNLKHIGINQEYYTDYTRALLLNLYPKQCPKCNGTEFKSISTRETEIFCANRECKTHLSLTSKTPANHYKLPIWTFSYLLQEAIELHPQPLTVSHIMRKLKLTSRNSGTNLKRRLQILLSDLIPVVKEMMKESISTDFSSVFELPDASVDVSEEVKDKAVVHSDVLALFSATRRANGFRTRYRHSGQTSSIYLTDEVAYERGFTQIGTLVHTLAIKKGPCLFTSIREQSQVEVEPLFNFLPPQTPIFTDEGFPYLKRHSIFHNCRQVNHSKRAKNQNRNVWGRDRYSCNGVHNNVAEGMQRVLKTNMRAHSYIQPKFSQLYLNEFSVLKAIRVYGLMKIVEKGSEMINCLESGEGVSSNDVKNVVNWGMRTLSSGESCFL